MNKNQILSTLIVVLSLISGIAAKAQHSDTLTNQTDAKGLKQGYWEEVQNRILAKGFYVDNKRDGTWTNYHPGGVVSEVTSYRMGVKDGQHLVIDKRGFLQADETFRNDQLHGLSTNYMNGTRKISEIYYRNGVEDGVKKMYYDNGKLQEQSFYKQGKRDGLSSWFDQSGRVIAAYEYKEGNFNGEHKTFYSNGQVSKKQTYINGVQEGVYEEFYENGQLKISGQMTAGKREGKWTEYDENGKANTVKYKNGEKK